MPYNTCLRGGGEFSEVPRGGKVQREESDYSNKTNRKRWKEKATVPSVFLKGWLLGPEVRSFKFLWLDWAEALSRRLVSACYSSRVNRQVVSKTWCHLFATLLGCVGK